MILTNITWEAFDEMGRTVLEKTGQPMLVVRASAVCGSGYPMRYIRP